MLGRKFYLIGSKIKSKQYPQILIDRQLSIKYYQGKAWVIKNVPIKMWNVFYMPILHCWILESLRQIFNPIPVIKRRKRITNTKRINQKKLDISIAFLLPSSPTLEYTRESRSTSNASSLSSLSVFFPSFLFIS